MLGRQVGSSLLRLPIRTRLVLRPTAPLQTSCPEDLAFRAFIFSAQRYYATPGRPRKAVGEPSRPVKRAAKRQARSTTNTDPASTLVKTRKSKPGPKPKAKAKKAAPKKTRKPLTDHQKELRAAKKEKDKIKELKVLALDPPTLGRALSAWTIFVQEKSAGKKGTPANKLMKETAEEWKEITPAQQEHYNHLAHEATSAAQAELKRWVESHSPDQIKQANSARLQLIKKLVPKSGKRSAKYKPIADERTPKNPLSSYILFAANRHHSGDFKNISVAERGRLIGKEWQALTDGEKKKYKDLEQEDRSRYAGEYKDTFGYMPSSNGGLQSASATA